MSTHVLYLPYDRPPLTLNQRWPSRQAKDSAVAEVRRSVGWVARAARLGRHDHVTVELHYRPGRAGIRDVDNLVATLKPACDGLVDAGLVADDDPAHMTKLMPVIHSALKTTGAGERRLWLQITPGPPPALTGDPVPADSPAFTDADAAAFTRLLSEDRARPARLVEIPHAPHFTPKLTDGGDPPSSDDGDDDEGGDGDDEPIVLVSVAIVCPDGRQVTSTAVLHEPLGAGELAGAVRGCSAGVLAQVAETDLL